MRYYTAKEGTSQPVFDRALGYYPAQKTSAFYGERSKGQKLPREPKTAIDFCLGCKKSRRKCNGNCALLSKFMKEQTK